MHDAVLAELLPVLALIGGLIIALYSKKGMGPMLLFGCGVWVAVFVIVAPLAFRQYTRAQPPKVYPLSHGKTRLKLSTFSIATDWEVRLIRSKTAIGGPADSLSLLSHDGKSEICLNVQSAKGSDLHGDYSGWVQSGADFMRTAGEPEMPTTFHSMPARKLSRTAHSADTFRLRELPADEQLTEDIIVVAWGDTSDSHLMYVVTGYPTGTSADKKAIDSVSPPWKSIDRIEGYIGIEPSLTAGVARLSRILGRRRQRSTAGASPTSPRAMSRCATSSRSRWIGSVDVIS